MFEPIVKTIEVPCSQEKAFRLFVEEMGAWWPLNRFSASVLRGEAAQGLRVEATVGGAIVEIGPDGTEHLWGTITAFTPYEAIEMDFHIAQPATSASRLELTFTPIAGDRTRVQLTQSKWEAFGKKAKQMYGGYAKGWAVIFDEAYGAACGGR